MTARGFAETISLNEAQVGVVAVKQSEPVSLRFPDVPAGRPAVRSRGEWEEFARFARGCAARGETTPLFASLGDGRTAEVEIAPGRIEALIALLMRACAFSEGRG